MFPARYELGLKKDCISYLKALNHFMINLYSSVHAFTNILIYFQTYVFTPQPTFQLEF